MGGSELFLFLFIVNFLVNNQAISAIVDSAGDYKQTWNANDQTKIFFSLANGICERVCFKVSR